MSEKLPQELIQGGGEIQAKRGSLLAAALSVEYGPCSVAAAELARQAQAVSELQFEGITQSQGMKPVVTKSQHPVRRHVSERVLGCITPVDEYDSYKNEKYLKELPFSIVCESSKQSRLFGLRRLKRKDVHGDNQKSIWLGYRIAKGRVLLPIATFELRENPHCSYVQLGPEINDDTVFAVQSDEQTERLALIEDLRKLVVDGWKDEPEYTKRVKNFVKSECVRNAEYISLALGDQIGRELSDKLNEHGEVKSAFLIDADGSTTIYEQSKSVIIHGLYESDESMIKAVQAGEDAPIILGVFTRGNVGFSIAEFWPSTGESRFVGAHALDAQDKYRSMMAIVELLDELDELDESPYLKYREFDKASRYLYETFKINEKIRQRLSPECKQQEDLARAIGNKAVGICFEGRVEDVDMITTCGSVSGYVKVNLVNDCVEARVVAKPDALRGIQPSEIASFVYDPTAPLGESLPKGHDANEFSRLINSFNKPKAGE